MKRIVSMIYVVFFPPDDHSEWEPPDPLPNSEVKPLSADGSVGSPHARVGHRQAFIQKKPNSERSWAFSHAWEDPAFYMWGRTACGPAARRLASFVPPCSFAAKARGDSPPCDYPVGNRGEPPQAGLEERRASLRDETSRNIVTLVASSGSLRGQSGGLDERAEGLPRRQAFIQKKAQFREELGLLFVKSVGVTHPHATTLSGTDQSCITKKPASERRRASWFQASFSKTAVAALCLERDGGDDQLARLQRTQAQAVAGFDDQKITGREYLAGDEFHTTTDQVPGSK